METIIQKALKLLLDKFGAKYDCVMVTEDAGHYRAVIECEETGRLIGRNGTILNAVQTVLKNILWQQTGERVFLTVDVGNYRQEQDEKVFSKVKKSIDWMKESNLSEVKLQPMSAYQRRMVHLWVPSEFPELTTDSIGEGHSRAIQIRYK